MQNEVNPQVAQIKEWLKNYAKTRFNLPLAHTRKHYAPHVVLEAGNQGLFGMLVPKEYGGLGLTYRDFVDLTEQIGAIDISLGLMLGIHNILGLHPLLENGSAELKANLLPDLAKGRKLAAFAITEPEAGSNPRGLRSEAISTPEGATLTGEKIWIGLASWASIITVFCKEYDEEGSPMGVSSFIVRTEQPGVSFGPESMTMGAQPIVQVPVLLNKVKVSDAYRLSKKGKGFPVAFSAMNLARFGLAAIALGAMKRCYQMVEQYASNRQINTGLLIENGYVLTKLSEMQAAIKTVEKLVYQIATILDSGQKVSDELYMACKIAPPEMLWQVVDTTMQLHGGRGYIEANFIPQIFRDARLIRIFEGPTEAIAYHLGSVVLNSSSANLFASLGAASQTSRTRLQSDVDQMRTQHLTQDASMQLRHVVSCGVGQIATLAALQAMIDPEDRQTQTWLTSQYELALTNMRSQIVVAKSVSTANAQEVAREYYANVGLLESHLQGEDWQSMVSNTKTHENAQAIVDSKSGSENRRSVNS